jgi:tetratricopeptide repeat protein 8
MSTRPGSSRPVSNAGRFSRMGTASLISEPGTFIDPQKLNLKKYAARPALAKILFEYLLHTENNARKALELASLVTSEAQ